MLRRLLKATAVTFVAAAGLLLPSPPAGADIVSAAGKALSTNCSLLLVGQNLSTANGTVGDFRALATAPEEAQGGCSRWKLTKATVVTNLLGTTQTSASTTIHLSGCCTRFMEASQFGTFAFGVVTVKDLNTSNCHNYVLRFDNNTVLSAHDGC